MEPKPPIFIFFNIGLGLSGVAGSVVCADPQRVAHGRTSLCHSTSVASPTSQAVGTVERNTMPQSTLKVRDWNAGWASL